MKVANESLRQHEVMASLNLHLLLDRYKHLQYMPTRKRMTGKNNSCDEVTTLVKNHFHAFYMHHSGIPGERIDAMSVSDNIMAGVVKTLALKVESGLIAVENLHSSIKEAVVKLIRPSEMITFNKVKALLNKNKVVGAKKLLNAYAYSEDESIAKAIKAEGERIAQRAIRLAMRHGKKARIGHNLRTLRRMCSLGFDFQKQIDKIQEFYGISETEKKQRMQFSVSDALAWKEAKALLINEKFEKLEKLPVLKKIAGAMKLVKEKFINLLLKKKYRESALKTLDNSSSAIVSKPSSTDEKVAQ